MPQTISVQIVEKLKANCVKVCVDIIQRRGH